MLQNQAENTSLYVALIGSAAAILTALRADKWPGYLYEWGKSRNAAKREYYQKKEAEFKKLINKVDFLERELQRERAFALQTKNTMRIMMPIMRRMSKDHPDLIQMLDEFERNLNLDVETTSADGHNTD
ncbi:hypothetical protein J0871_16870 [Salegentibacter sp. BDJ18]|uniref:hypothetical protein n=1 Tax=Salegentibacter sp. BDJ18 TaxID=2816376 RepID=UPI001AAE8A3F|nr:hypothetical protein [Salegentibacter sp. BDJ18]MBO2546091.1 hypothetical protein [Salegentibacter sp. BDJ18]